MLCKILSEISECLEMSPRPRFTRRIRYGVTHTRASSR